MSIRSLIFRFIVVAVFSLVAMVFSPVQPADAFTNQYTEDFSTRQYCDTLLTTADWDTLGGELKLPPFHVSLLGNCDLSQSNAVDVDGFLAYVADYQGGVRVVDVSNPSNPTLVASLTAASPATDIVVDGDHAYVTCGYQGLKVLDLHDATNPSILGECSLSGVASGVAVTGNYAFVASGTAGLHVIAVNNPATPIRIATYNTGGSASAVAVAGDRAYVADAEGGFVILDVSNPAAPALLSTLSSMDGFPVGITLVGVTAYVAAHTGGLVIVDVSDPTQPQVLSTTPTAYRAYDVAVSGDLAYVAQYDGGLMIVDVSDSSMPTVVEERQTVGSARGLALGGRYIFVADYYSGLTVLQISEEVHPELLGSYSGAFADVAVSGRYAYLSGSGALRVVDFSDPESPLLLGSCSTGFTYDLALDGKYAYVGTAVGVAVYDVTVPTAPVFVVHAILGSARFEGLTIAGDYAFAVESSYNLAVIDISDPENPFLATRIIQLELLGLAVSGDYAYLVGVDGSVSYFATWNISNPAAPVQIGSDLSLPAGAGAVAISGNYAYVACGYGDVIPIDISDPANPVAGQGCPMSGFLNDVEIQGDRAYVADWNGGMQILDISSPMSPVLLENIPLPGNALQSVRLSGGIACIAGSAGFGTIAVHDYKYEMSDGLGRSLDLNDSGHPIMRARLSTTQTDLISWKLIVDGDEMPATPGGGWSAWATPGLDLRWQSEHELVEWRSNPTCSQLEIEWLFDCALSTGITDIPEDQGGWLRLGFQRSGADFPDASPMVASYYLWRRVDDPILLNRIESDAEAPLQAPAPRDQSEAFARLDERTYLVPNGDALRGFPPGVWEAVGSLPALQQETYLAAVPSRGDSLPEEIPYTVFCVSAHTTDPAIWYVSPPDSGYSVDNIAPGVPMDFVVDHENDSVSNLSWTANAEPDFQYYRVYRGDSEIFEIGPETLVHETAETSWTDTGGGQSFFYKLTAMDHAGNESDAASPDEVAGVDDTSPATFALHQNSPNPLNPSTEIRFVLAEPSRVSLTVFDLAGRRVCELLGHDELVAGNHNVQWHGVDGQGNAVPSGVYLYRLEVGEHMLTRKMTLLK